MHHPNHRLLVTTAVCLPNIAKSEAACWRGTRHLLQPSCFQLIFQQRLYNLRAGGLDEVRIHICFHYINAFHNDSDSSKIMPIHDGANSLKPQVIFHSKGKAGRKTGRGGGRLKRSQYIPIKKDGLHIL